MSIESFEPIPVEVFGTWMTLLDPSDVPLGLSPDLRDVEYFPGGVRTRAGLLAAFPALASSVQVNGLKSYITPNLRQRLLVFDSLGNFYKETSPGVPRLRRRLRCRPQSCRSSLASSPPAARSSSARSPT